MQRQYNPLDSYDAYLKGGGETGRLIRMFDWAETELGFFDKWPTSLLLALSIILNSKFPMFIWWGSGLIQFYNDAYLPSLGKDGRHPHAIGQKGKDCWPENWPIIGPMIEGVMNGGGSTWNEDQLLPIFRNNRMEEAFWTFSYSCLNGDDGKPSGVLAICQETTEKVLYNNAIHKNKIELDFVIEAAQLSTWDWDIETGIMTGNKRLRDWCGVPLSSSNYITTAIQTSIIPEDREMVSAAIAKALEKNSTGNYNVIYTIIHPTNLVRRIIKAKGKTLFDTNGNALRFSGILQDITEEYSIQLRKDEFLSVASHEIKTPLTTLKCSLQVLEMIISTNADPSKVPLLLNKASSNVEKLLDIIEDLMNATKIQQGQIQLNKEWFKIADLINSCLENQLSIEKYDIQLTGDLEVQIYADQRRIEQVLINFINNAIKYASNSTNIDINIEKSKNSILVTVTDYGMGIMAEKIPYLFDRYYKVDNSGSQFAGLGLGLYICSDIIQRHRGEIGVNSTVGEGSKFWFILPIYG